MASHDTSLSPEELKAENRKRIFVVTAILAAITSVEFALAFAWPDGADRSILNFLFLALTVVKAFYIVADFMHMKHEVKALMWSIVAPLVFIVWLVIALFIEGEEIFAAIVRYM